MANPCVADYLFWPLEPVRIWRNLARAGCLTMDAYDRPSLAIVEIERGLDKYRDGLESSEQESVPESGPSPGDYIVPLLEEKGLVDIEDVAALRGISVGRSRMLFIALTRTCRACGQRNFVAFDECWHCDAALPDAVNWRKWQAIPGYLLPPQDLHVEKLLKERNAPRRTFEYGPERGNAGSGDILVHDDTVPSRHYV